MNSGNKQYHQQRDWNEASHSLMRLVYFRMTGKPEVNCRNQAISLIDLGALRDFEAMSEMELFNEKRLG